MREAQIRKLRTEVYDDYLRATEGRLFTKEFNSRLEAVMYDRQATVDDRVLSWILRYSWGEYSLFAIKDDGQPRHQRDCCNELTLKKHAVSPVVRYLKARGYLEDRAKLLVPIIDPKPDAMSVPPKESKSWAEFVEWFKVAHAADFEKLEIGRSMVAEVRTLMRSLFKESQQQNNKDAASLLFKTSESRTETPAGQESTPLQERRRRRRSNAPANPTAEGGNQARDQARQFLFEHIGRLQQAFPKSPFARVPIDPNNTDDVATVDRILNAIGSCADHDMISFWLWVTAKMKGLTLQGRGVYSQTRSPEDPTGPQGFGLLVVWARDYARLANPQAKGRRNNRFTSERSCSSRLATSRVA